MKCKVDNCLRDARKGRRDGLCGMHEKRRRLGQDMEAPIKRLRAPFEHLYLIVESGCWEWIGTLSQEGYGRFEKDFSHRVSYRKHVGEIPDGLQIDHLCRNRKCCNPEHLEPVTPRVNTLRGQAVSAINAVKTECIHGHPFDEDNTGVRKNGHRWCRACSRRRSNARRRQLRGTAA